MGARRLLLCCGLTALWGTGAEAQGLLKELKWRTDGAASVGGEPILRCAPGQEVQLSLEGEDASMQRVPLNMYAPAVTSSDERVVRAVMPENSAGTVNVRCVADGEAWLTAETMGKQARYGVLVGGFRRQARVGEGRATAAASQASTTAVAPVASGTPIAAGVGRTPATTGPQAQAPSSARAGTAAGAGPPRRERPHLMKTHRVRKGDALKLGLNTNDGPQALEPVVTTTQSEFWGQQSVGWLLHWVEFGPPPGSISPCLTVSTDVPRGDPAGPIPANGVYGVSGRIQPWAPGAQGTGTLTVEGGSIGTTGGGWNPPQPAVLSTGSMSIQTKDCRVGLYDLDVLGEWMHPGGPYGGPSQQTRARITIEVIP